MYKRIAVAVDGSETSSRALKEAIGLARLMDASLLLLHVCEEAPVMWEAEGMGVIPMEGVTEAFVLAGKKLLAKDASRASGQGIVTETKLVENYGGRIGEAISDEARNWGADLLVVGTHGRKGIGHLLLGSVAEGVMRTAAMPVLMVRTPE